MPLFRNRTSKEVDKLYDLGIQFNSLICENIPARWGLKNSLYLKIFGFSCALSVAMVYYKLKGDPIKILKETTSFWAGLAVKNKDNFGYTSQTDRHCADLFMKYYFQFSEELDNLSTSDDGDYMYKQTESKLIKMFDINEYETESIEFESLMLQLAKDVRIAKRIF